MFLIIVYLFDNLTVGGGQEMWGESQCDTQETTRIQQLLSMNHMFSG